MLFRESFSFHTLVDKYYAVIYCASEKILAKTFAANC